MNLIVGVIYVYKWMLVYMSVCIHVVLHGIVWKDLLPNTEENGTNPSDHSYVLLSIALNLLVCFQCSTIKIYKIIFKRSIPAVPREGF